MLCQQARYQIFGTRASNYFQVQLINTFYRSAAQILALVWAFFIPRVETSVYFNRDANDGKLPETFTKNRITDAFQLIWIHFKSSYKQKTVVLWSFYYAIALCFYIQITAYIQVLWISIDDTQEVIYNGAVDAILTLLGAGVSLLAGKIHMSFLRKHNRTLLSLIIMSTLQGVFVVLAATSRTLISCYIFYICFGVSYAFAITICATEIAKNLAEDTFGLVFGFNTLIALIVQTSTTLSVVSYGFKLSPSGQYQVYGYFYIALGAIYLVNLLFNLFKRNR